MMVKGSPEDENNIVFERSSELATNFITRSGLSKDELVEKERPMRILNRIIAGFS